MKAEMAHGQQQKSWHDKIFEVVVCRNFDGKRWDCGIFANSELSLNKWPKPFFPTATFGSKKDAIAHATQLRELN